MAAEQPEDRMAGPLQVNESSDSTASPSHSYHSADNPSGLPDPGLLPVAVRVEHADELISGAISPRTMENSPATSPKVCRSQQIEI